MTQSIPHTANRLPAVAELTESEQHRLLSSERRRRILAVLLNRSGPMTCEELATSLARSAARGADPADVRDLRISLHHTHLAAMDEFGVVDYDPATNTVEPVA